ncbi:hypothetical protein HK104_007781, partial [Borealophlyctis nickersoniae]
MVRPRRRLKESQRDQFDGDVAKTEREAQSGCAGGTDRGVVYDCKGPVDHLITGLLRSKQDTLHSARDRVGVALLQWR